MKKNLIAIAVFCLSMSSCGVTPSIGSSFNSDIPSDTSETASQKPECQHVLEEHSVIKEATIYESGIKDCSCIKCGVKIEKTYYDLSQFVFKDAYFMHDGNEHQITIKGMIPYGTTVEYENNALTEIGEKEATANIYNENHELIASKKAKIHIVENTGLANIYIDTNNVQIVDKENYVSMTLSTTNCEDNYVLNNVAGGIRFRGNGTMTYDKKAYRLKFNSKVGMLGVNDEAKAKSWVLLAEYADQSMVRNATAYCLGNSLFNYSNNYCSDSRHVNVYLNGEYEGVYVLAEQQQANTNRIKIEEAEEDYTGTDIGYLVELDYYAKDEVNTFSIGTSSGWGMSGENINGVNIPAKDYTIKTDIYDQSQISYIKKYMTNVFTALKNIFKDGTLKVLDENHNLIDSPYTTQYETLNSMIDLESMFKMYLLHEYMKNVDVGFSSFYMFVDFSANSLYPRLTFGAPWDFDWSSGNVNVENVKTSSGEYNSTDFNNKNVWFYLLTKTDFFRTMFKRYYAIFVNSGILEGAIANANYLADAFKDDFAHNYERWNTLGTVIYKYTPDDVKSFKVHKDAVNYLTDWLSKRKTSLDNIFLE